jgi:hypothetical protein
MKFLISFANVIGFKLLTERKLVNVENCNIGVGKGDSQKFLFFQILAKFLDYFLRIAPKLYWERLEKNEKKAIALRKQRSP